MTYRPWPTFHALLNKALYFLTGEAGVLESVKAASDIFSPVSGEVTELNNNVTENPEIINKDPYGEGRCQSKRVFVEMSAKKIFSHLYIYKIGSQLI